MDQRLQDLSQPDLVSHVRQALSLSHAEIASWKVEALSGGTGSAIGGTALFRVAGKTTQQQPWSLILKILYERPGEAIDSPYYWKREFELYRAGLFGQLPDSGIRAPRIFGCLDFTESCWIWMEDIDNGEHGWTLETYSVVARDLGRFNGAFVAGKAIPQAAWLADYWHCQIIIDLDDTFDALDSHLQHPLVRRALPAAERETILAIWRDVPRFRDALFGLPQTLCHNDAFPRNLLRCGDDFVLIDWALAGRGAIGEELTSMVSLSLYADPSPKRAARLDRTVFDGYIEGLRDAGWTGCWEQVRLGYTCAMTLRGLAGVAQDIRVLSDEQSLQAFHPGLDTNGINEIADRYAQVRKFRLIRMADEARQLLSNL